MEKEFVKEKNILTLSQINIGVKSHLMKKIIFISLILLFKLDVIQASFLQKKDSINFTDANDKKQGKWIVYNKTAHLPNYTDDQKVAEGIYMDGKRIGIWKEYFPNGVLKSKITYDNGRPNGYAIMYHDNGKIKEEGLWQNTRWIGDYKLYYDNGQVQQEFKFSQSGKREGQQKYYFENGQVMIEGNWIAGNESGVIKEYYENGDIREEKNFNNGSFDPASSKSYEPKKPNPVKPPEEKVVPPPIIPQKTEKDNLGKQFTGEGYWKLYNMNKQVSKEGTFRRSMLMDGKSYIYNDDGILMRIAVYKEGRYVGDAVIEDEK